MNGEKLRLLQEEVTQLRNEGKYQESIELSYKLLKLGMESNDYKSILIAHINNAIAYYMIGDIEEAFKSISLHEKICSKHGDNADKLNLYSTVFVLYEYMKDYSNAKKTLKKTIDLGKRLGAYNMVGNAYSNFCHVLIKESNYKEALEMGMKGLEMAKLHKPRRAILEIRVKLNVILAYIGLEDFDTSGPLIEEIINDPLLDSFTREKGQSYILQGEWYFKQNMYMEAFESYTNAKQLVESYNDIHLLKEIQEKRCKLCELMDDIQEGYLAQKEYIELLDIINEKELSKTALKYNIKHNLASIEKKANTDFLTGLYNRNYLEETTNQWLKEASLDKENIACIVLDIDNFKSINDEFGHLIGDDIIKLISKSCTSLIREQDMIGRYGGDEFVIVLRGSTLEQGQEIAERIRAKLQDLNIEKLGKSIPIKVSMGVADNLKGTILTFNDLFHQADMRLYRAKQNGKDQICAFG